MHFNNYRCVLCSLTLFSSLLRAHSKVKITINVFLCKIMKSSNSTPHVLCSFHESDVKQSVFLWPQVHFNTRTSESGFSKLLTFTSISQREQLVLVHLLDANRWLEIFCILFTDTKASVWGFGRKWGWTNESIFIFIRWTTSNPMAKRIQMTIAVLHLKIKSIHAQHCIKITWIYQTHTFSHLHLEWLNGHPGAQTQRLS